jgi:hypothetical protein
MISMGMGSLAASSILKVVRNPYVLVGLKRPVFAGWLLYFCLTLASFSMHDDAGLWWDECRVKLPMLLVPLAVSANKNSAKIWYFPSLALFISVVTAVNLATLAYYFGHFEACNALILASKPVPIQTTTKSLSHIYFGIMSAFAGCAGLYLWRKNPNSMGIYMLICGSVCVFCLHLFASRTGLLTLYGAVACAACYQVYRHEKWRKYIWLTPILPAIGAASVAMVPSLNNRYKNTVEDVKAYLNNEDVTHRSLSKRILVWGFAAEIWQANPWFGVGPGNVKPEILSRYEGSKYRVETKERVADPHNQFLEAGAGLGILGFSTLLFIFASSCLNPIHPLMLMLWVILALGMLGESLLERQVGVSFSLLYWSLVTKNYE